MFDMQKVGERIAALRRKENMTQAELAEKLGISYQAVSSWERGATMPDISKLLELSRALRTSVDALLSGKEAVAAPEKVEKEQFAETEKAAALDQQAATEAEEEAQEDEDNSFSKNLRDLMTRMRANLNDRMETLQDNLQQMQKQFASDVSKAQATVTIQQNGKNKYVIHIPDDEQEKTQTRGKVSADMMSALACHMDQDMLEDVLVDAINDSDEDVVSEIACYMEPETIDRAMERATEPLTAEIMSELSSYMGADALEKCAVQALAEEDDEMLEEIVSHLDEDVLERALERFEGELTLEMVETLAWHASEKALDLIIQKCDIEDSEVVEELSSYLNQRQMRELINRFRKG